MDAGLKVSGGSVSADLTIEGDLSVQDVATLGAGLLDTAAVTIPAADAFTLKKISFEVAHGADENIFSVGGTATIRSLQADAVFTLRKKTGRSSEAAAGARALRFRLRQLDLPLAPAAELEARRPRR